MDLLGSSYVGNYKNGRIEGKGQYSLPSGSTYVGEMKDGMFHGLGKIVYPDGGIYSGKFSNGHPISGTYQFPDGLLFSSEKEPYCDGYDRRFHSEIQHGLKPPGDEKLHDKSEIKIPNTFYDIGDGFYDPENRIVYDYEMHFLRNADVSEHEWATQYGLKGWDEFTNGQHNHCKTEKSSLGLSKNGELA